MSDKTLNLNFNFHWTWFKERKALGGKDLTFRLLQIFMAEMLGTMMLVFWGCNSLGHMNTGDPIVACWLFGNIVFIAIQTFGTDNLSDLDYGYHKSDNFCVTMVGVKKAWKGMVLEACGTAVLCFMIGRICNPLNPKGLRSIMFVFSLAIMILGYSLAPWTGASVNPARSLGPALMTGQFKDHWVYWIGPMSGSLIASFLYHIFFLPKVEYLDDDTVQPAASTEK
ncbi:aquaporin isoform X2 [Halyomorpha halys]|uniref:aquaporin isoform X2 n=1 Tax=Halyomorpha halys TaxID=286706 RepID=UPI0006D4FB8E|nr:aquaporin-like isoform X2 [Halyomorpha halys]